MQIQINTDHNIEGHESMAAQVRSVVESALSRVSDHVTRVEVHLSNEGRHGSSEDDMRCMMEARLEGRQPVVVTHQAANLTQVVDGAVHKLTKLIESTVERLRDHERRVIDPPSVEPTLPED